MYTGDYERRLEDASKNGKVPLSLALKIVEEMSVGSIQWSVEDFEMKAWDICGDDWENVYDKNKFQAVLVEMIDNHDCNNGVTWDDIEYYLNEYCKK